MDMSNEQKRGWVTPELTRMSIDETLGGIMPNPSEEHSGNESAAGDPNFGMS
ncbi:hypothetical protein LY622_16740 [Halomonas sp. M5N1S17]|uniref:hypothetical protein n=1 Tax=Halomonas alkalisoli TaxID=2907158 RepID=UPI001F23542B|nr:hypothetical protein [Halomonas alkalisoli]MCE9665078.1 hypothetical protein [Halomonas alkalisoli]